MKSSIHQCIFFPIKQLKNMDNINTQKMDNWKKQVIMDPVLNSLFDPTISTQDLLNTKILTLTQDQIINVYTRLTTLKHVFSRALQKEVQNKNHHIEKAFENVEAYREDFSVSNNPKMHEYLNHLKKFNAKYELVNESMFLWKNITKVLHFSEALQSIIVQSKILRTLMRGYDGNQERQQSINALKISKLVHEINLKNSKFDFSGIKTFENQKVFISNTKILINQSTEKSIKNYLNKAYQEEEIPKKELVEYIETLVNLGTLEQFLNKYFKKNISEISEKIKNNFQGSIEEFTTFFQSQFVPLLIKNSYSFLLLDEVLVSQKYLESLNLFLKFWSRLTEFLGQQLAWMRDQEKRKPPKNEEGFIHWKYPIFYQNFCLICNKVHEIMLKLTEFNEYNFGKCRQKLMFTLLATGEEYHKQCQQMLENKIFCGEQLSEEGLVERIGLFNFLISNCQHQLIFDWLMKKVCEYEGIWRKNLQFKNKIRQTVIQSPFTVNVQQFKLLKKEK